MSGATVADEYGRPHEALDLAQRGLGLPELRRVIKRGRDRALYELVLEDGTVVPLGDVAAITSGTKVRLAIIDALTRYVPRLAGKGYEPICEALLSLAEVIDDGQSPLDEVRAWLSEESEYHRGRLVDLTDPEERLAVVRDGRSVLHATDGRVYVRLEALVQRAQRLHHVNVTGREVGARLAALDFERVKLRETNVGGEGRRQRWYLASPVGFDVHGEASGSGSSIEKRALNPGGPTGPVDPSPKLTDVSGPSDYREADPWTPARQAEGGGPVPRGTDSPLRGFMEPDRLPAPATVGNDPEAVG